jgi:hypothetical protein
MRLQVYINTTGLHIISTQVSILLQEIHLFSDENTLVIIC